MMFTCSKRYTLFNSNSLSCVFGTLVNRANLPVSKCPRCAHEKVGIIAASMGLKFFSKRKISSLKVFSKIIYEEWCIDSQRSNSRGVDCSEIRNFSAWRVIRRWKYVRQLGDTRQKSSGLFASAVWDTLWGFYSLEFCLYWNIFFIVGKFFEKFSLSLFYAVFQFCLKIFPLIAA